MLNVVLVRSGITDFDAEGRIQGTLDIPLNQQGRREAEQLAEQLRGSSVEVIYSSPCQSARQTADIVAAKSDAKVKQLDKLVNVNHGLWQGLLLEEVKHKQPKVFRQWQQHPETVCAPEGEMLSEAQERVQIALNKLLRKHDGDTIAVVAPEPLASVIRGILARTEPGETWAANPAGCAWEKIAVEPRTLAAAH